MSTTTSATKNPPAAAGAPILGSALAFRRNPADFLLRAHREHGDVVGFRLGPQQVYLLAHPDHVRQILTERIENYPKAGYNKLEPLIGKGLLSSEGSLWRRQRRLMQPAFHKERIAGMVDAMTEPTLQLAADWKAAARTGGEAAVVDVEEEMTRLTLSIVSRTLFSRDVSDRAGSVGRALRFVLWFGTNRIGRFVTLPETVPTPKNFRYRRSLAALDDVVYSLIEERRKSGEDHGDLLSMLMSARDEDGEGMSEKQMRDEVMTILTAGHETTAKALTWTFYLLDRHPVVAEQLREELAQVLGGRPPRYEDLARLPYTKMVLQEAMRVYTPVWGLARKVKEDDEVDGYKIEAGSRVIVSPYATHRHPRF